MPIQATRLTTLITNQQSGTQTEIWYVDTPTQSRAPKQFMRTRQAIIGMNGRVTNQQALGNGQIRIWFDVPVSPAQQNVPEVSCEPAA